MEWVPVGDLEPNRRNAKKHPDRQIALIAENYKQFGVTQLIVIDEDGMILCGHARYFAAQKLEITDLPAIRLSHLSPSEKRALALADNKLAELGEWDRNILAEEIEFLFDPNIELSFDPRVIGFDTPEKSTCCLGTNRPAPIPPTRSTHRPRRNRRHHQRRSVDLW